MEQFPVNGQLPSSQESVSLENRYHGKYRGFAAFIICCGILLAAFAVSAIWLQKGGNDWLHGLGSFWGGEETTVGDADGKNDPSPNDSDTDTTSDSNPTDPEPIPDGAMPVVTLDLTRPDLGQSYIHNETPYNPSVEELLSERIVFSNVGEEPLVLIIHTHTSESYLPTETTYIQGVLGDAVYSREEGRNVLSVGRTLCDRLNQKGITAIHCTVMHDDPTLSGSYSRSEKTVKEYLERYPSIELVIDLHRDSVTTSRGELVRAATEIDGESVAQVMAVIGTDCNGTPHKSWEENLALALQLREALNGEGASLCRPVSLRNASYHQELAAHALLLEIGTAANSIEEAERAAILVGDALAILLQER